MSQISEVESILNKLNTLESDIEKISILTEELRKKLSLFVDKEIDNMRLELLEKARKEADNIINKARNEAEGESNKILLDAERNIAIIENNVTKSFNTAVEIALKRILKG
ncbi:MAG: hypothetical protein QW416_02405 [Candidatus Nitrosocaldaceae archaeon]